MDGAKGRSRGSARIEDSGKMAELASILHQDEIDRVLELLEPDAGTLDDIVRGFRDLCPSGDLGSKFRMGTVLALLLRDNLLTAAQRLGALYVLATLYRDHPGGLNPFLPFFIEPLEANSSVAVAERKFTCDLLLSPPSKLQVGDKSASAALEEYRNRGRELSRPDLETLWRAFRSKVPPVPPLLDLEMRPVILDPEGEEAEVRRQLLVALQTDVLPSVPEDVGVEGFFRAVTSMRWASKDGEVSPASIAAKKMTGLVGGEVPSPGCLDASAGIPLQRAKAVPSLDPSSVAGYSRMSTGGGGGGLSQKISSGGAGTSSSSSSQKIASSSSQKVTSGGAGFDTARGFRPQFARPAPPLLELSDSELSLPGVMPALPLLWDGGIGVDADKAAELRSLLIRAATESLSTADADRTRSLLLVSPRLVSVAGLEPSALPRLVEHNPAIATICLQQLRHASSPRLPEFLSSLVSMDLSLRSMEVVNQLTNSNDLPPEFVHMYVSNCIATCEATEEKYHKHRLVRLVCVFLHSLIKHKRVRISDLFVEIQAFCIEFSKIREAQALYALVRTQEGAPPAPE